MRHSLVAAAALVLALVVACGPPEPPPPTPVAATPLTGTIDGKSWTAAAATASGRKAFSDAGEKWIDVGASAFTCATFIPDVEVIGTVPWVAGTAYNLSLAQNLTILTRKADGGTVNNISTNGRVEIISAPATGKGTIRIRASYGTGNSIEGQVDVSVCD